LNEPHGNGGSPLRVLACTRGRNVPSARFRVQQYVGVLASAGVQLVEAPALLKGYPPRNRLLRVPWGAGVLAERAADATRSWKYDLTLLQREMVANLLTVERFTRRPRLLDVDDAIWVPAGRRFAERLAGLVDRIVCGNDYLADRFSQWHERVAIIPTAVDTARFKPDPARRQPNIIGWSGSSSGLPYLYDIEDAIHDVLRRNPDVRLRVVSDRAPRFQRIAHERVEFIPWSRAVEVPAIQEMTIGLMPLRDTEWERGKCSYKMLLYAACGVPSIVSPVGMNAELLRLSPLGVSAASDAEWAENVHHLLRSEGEATRLGNAGRRLVCEKFNVEHWGHQLARELRQAAGVADHVHAPAMQQ